jgi:hypothetical protein
MIGADDISQMRADMAEVRGDNDASIVLRRGATTLAAQTVRVARKNRGGRFAQSGQAQESRGEVIVSGAIDLDIQAEDRFNLDGVLYRIVFVQPNRTMSTVAEATAVE